MKTPSTACFARTLTGAAGLVLVLTSIHLAPAQPARQPIIIAACGGKALFGTARMGIKYLMMIEGSLPEEDFIAAAKADGGESEAGLARAMVADCKGAPA